jgi:FdhD protein
MPEFREHDPGAGGRPTRRLRGGVWSDIDDLLVVEEPLEIRVNGRRFTVTMRTPGDDFDMARGLLFGEGLIASAADVGSIRYCDTGEEGDGDSPNVMVVQTRAEHSDDSQWQRNLISATSCGLCGAAAIDAVVRTVTPIRGDSLFTAAQLLSFPGLLRESQPIFTRTGGLHAAGIFDGDGVCRAVFEDIGRHNATDKAIGKGLAEGWIPWNPADGPLALLVSGRASFEIVQKALVARIPVVCSVSAASTLAVDLAGANNQTLIGFLRDTGMTVYTGHGRVDG